MGLYNLDKVFKPASIAVVGASERHGSIGNAVMTNLMEGKFEGELFPVHPTHSRIHGLRAFPALKKLSISPDLVVVCTPIDIVPEIVDECVVVGAGGAVIISAGGKEVGEKGRRIESEIWNHAAKRGLRIVGPNCLGVICPGRKMNASFASHMPQSGNLAFVSQSGAICTAILDVSLKEGIGFSHFVSVGSMLDVDFGDLIDYLGNDPEVRSILLYVESLTNFRKFMSASRAVSRVKPIVVLKSGRSAAGARAAASHTGAMAGQDDVYDAAFHRAGIVRVDTIGELFDCAELIAKVPRPRGARLAVVTNAGGPGVMAADALAKYGREPAALEPATLEKLDDLLPSYWSRGNPIDMLGDASPERYSRTLEICLQAQELDAVLAILAPQALADPATVAEDLVRLMRGKSFPLFACWMGGKDVEEGVLTLNRGGIPTYDTPERAVQAFMYMVEYSRNMQLLQEVPSRLSRPLRVDSHRAEEIIREGIEPGSEILTEYDSKRLLAAYGLTVNRTEKAVSVQEALEAAREIGYPVVMKILSPDISHKTDADGVRLDLRNEKDVREAFETIMEGARRYRSDARIQGVTLQAMVPRGDFEILMGGKRDDNFGPVVMFGLGGVLTEILKDRGIGLPPLNRLLARRLMETTRVFSLLHGYRNRPPADMESMEEALVRLSQLLVDIPEIAELDMNPVILVQGKPCVVDARVRLEPSLRKSPMHLVISPYPTDHESEGVTSGGIPVFIRPMKPEDADLFVQLFQSLSPTSIYYRFFSRLVSLTPAMLARFTQVDYDREIALTAVSREDGKDLDRMLGVARIVSDPDGRRGEFAVLVGDPWQGRGVGAMLLQECLRIAKERGIESVWGTVLQENRQMIELGRKLGFEIRHIPNTHEYEMDIDLHSFHVTREE